MSFKVNFGEILGSRKCYNLDMMEKRLILRAMIKTNFSIAKSYRLNCGVKNPTLTLDGYDKKFRRHFDCGATELRGLWSNYLQNKDEKKRKSSRKRSTSNA